MTTTNTIIDSGSQNAKPSSFNVAAKWGLIGALINIIFGLGAYYANGGDMSRSSGWLHWVLLIGTAAMITFMAMKEMRDRQLGGYITFGKAYGIGLLTALVFILLATVYSYVFFYYIVDFDAMVGSMMDESVKQMKEQGKSQQEIETALSYSKPFMTRMSFTIWGTVMNVILYLIISLITAAIAKKSPPQY